MLKFLKYKVLPYLDRMTGMTGIDFRYVARGSSWSTIDLFVSNVASLLMAMAFSRLLPKEAYGTYNFILSWVGIFSTFAISGITGAINRSIAAGFEGDLQEALHYKFKWSLISSVLSLGFATYYFFQADYVLAISFSIAAILIPPYLASTVVASFYFGKQMFGYNTLMAIAVRVCSLATMVSLVFITDSVPLILSGYFIPDFFVRSYFYLLAVRKHQVNKKTSEDTKKFELHLTVMNVIGGISRRFDSILLFHTIGAVELAIYKFALLPFEKIQTVIGILIGISGPRFAKRDYKEIYKSLGGKLIWFNLLFAGIGLAAFFALPFLFRLLFPEYLESVTYGRILLLPLVFSAPAVIQSLWSAKAEIKKLYILKIITHVSRIAAFAIFIPLYSIQGAIWSQVVIAFIAGIYIFIMYLKDKAKILQNESPEDKKE